MDKHQHIEAILTNMVQKVADSSYIDPALYEQYDVKRGLRNPNGSGVLVGITRVGNVVGYRVDDGKKIPVEGELHYRGIKLTDLVTGMQADNRMGFEETAYLLLFGELPTKRELTDFNMLLENKRGFPRYFAEDNLFRTPTRNIMNMMQRAILALYAYDGNPEDTSLSNAVRQSINLMAKIPMIMAYAFHAKQHYFDGDSLVIHHPKVGVGTAENILHMTRKNMKYTRQEAELLDLCMVVHAEHGGGNNSAFATHVVSSTGTDTYSAIATALGSLKGPKHGGANLMVANMIHDIKAHVPEWWDRAQLKEYLRKILNKEAFNRKGLVYGMGHAVYTLSDPRAVLLKEKARELAKIKGYEREFNLISDIEELTIELYKERRGPDAIIAANVDLYAGVVYEMLGIHPDLYTPIFAISRTAGWCAHRLEQIRDEKIMRPAYVTLETLRPYTSISNRQKELA